MFHHPGKFQLVLSKRQLRSQRRVTPPATRRPGCLDLKNMCSLSAGLCFLVEPVTLKTEDKLNAPSLYERRRGVGVETSRHGVLFCV